MITYQDWMLLMCMIIFVIGLVPIPVPVSYQNWVEIKSPRFSKFLISLFPVACVAFAWVLVIFCFFSLALVMFSECLPQCL